MDASQEEQNLLMAGGGDDIAKKTYKATPKVPRTRKSEPAGSKVSESDITEEPEHTTSINTANSKGFGYAVDSRHSLNCDD